MRELSNEADSRLGMLTIQRERIVTLRQEVEGLNSENDECGWDTVLGAIQDTESMIQSAIDSIAEWDNERAKDHAEELADFRRGLRDED